VKQGGEGHAANLARRGGGARGGSRFPQNREFFAIHQGISPQAPHRRGASLSEAGRFRAIV
jgi:hypothetical protein